MSEKKTKTSRRAQRRARSEEQELDQREGEAQESDDEESDDEEAESDDDESDDEEDDDSDDEESDEDESDSEDDEEASEEDEEAREAAEIRQIRDRNKRMRAKAAAKRRARRTRGGAAPAVGLDAGEMVDDVLSRSTAKAGKFVQKNFRVLQWVLVAGLVGGTGWYVYDYVHHKSQAEATDVLMVGVRAEKGMIEDDRPLPEEMGVQTFKDHSERLKTAEDAYRKALGELKNDAGLTLAHLGLAGVLFDQSKHDDAKAEYQIVVDSKLAQIDNDVKGRALEGLALVAEAKGDKPGATEGFKKLEDVPGFGPLGKYQQARMAYAAGDTEGAKKLLEDIQSKLKDDKDARVGYVYGMTMELLAAIDPKAAEAAQKSVPQSPEEMMKQLQEMEDKLKNMQAPAGEILKKLGLSPSGQPLAPTPSGSPEPTPAPAPSGGAPAPSGGQ